jgi:hypothetical protein
MFELTHISSHDYVVFIFVVAAGGQVLLHRDQFVADLRLADGLRRSSASFFSFERESNPESRRTARGSALTSAHLPTDAG